MRLTPAQRRYNRRVLILSIIYAAVLMLAVYLLRRHLVSGAAAYVIGILPGLAVSGFFWLMGRYLVEEGDEYVRMLMTRQILIATGIALTASTIWGFLEGFALVPHIVGYIWSIVWIVGLGIGAGVNFAIERRRA